MFALYIIPADAGVFAQMRLLCILLRHISPSGIAFISITSEKFDSNRTQKYEHVGTMERLARQSLIFKTHSSKDKITGRIRLLVGDKR